MHFHILQVHLNRGPFQTFEIQEILIRLLTLGNHLNVNMVKTQVSSYIEAILCSHKKCIEFIIDLGRSCSLQTKASWNFIRGIIIWCVHSVGSQHYIQGLQRLTLAYYMLQKYRMIAAIFHYLLQWKVRTTAIQWKNTVSIGDIKEFHKEEPYSCILHLQISAELVQQNWGLP